MFGKSLRGWFKNLSQPTRPITTKKRRTIRLALETLEDRIEPSLTPVSFLPLTDYPAGSGTLSVAVGDTNHDGKLDLVTGSVASGVVAVLLGNGDGILALVQLFGTSSPPYAVALGDLNGDDKLDVVAGGSGHTVFVLLGNGDGTLGAASTYTTP